MVEDEAKDDTRLYECHWYPNTCLAFLDQKRTRPRKGSVKGKMRTFNTHTDTTIFKWVAFNSLTCPRKLQTSGKKSDDARTEGRIK